jgi:hypothetical protein
LTVLSLRALNRATLARQLLLQRSPMSALDAIEHLVGMQAQAPFAPYYGLWSRLDGFTGEELSGLLTARKAVRIVLMRGTIHLVTAKDCHRLRPLLQPTLERALRMNTTDRKDLEGVDLPALAEQAKRILDAEALTPLYDIPDAPRPHPDVPAPVRLTAPFDNILLSHADRTRVISDEHRKRLFSGKNGVFPGTVLVDGFVAGTWELVGTGEATSLQVLPHTRLKRAAQGEVVSEANRLLACAFGVAEPHVAITA